MFRSYCAAMACKAFVNKHLKAFLRNERGESSVMSNIMMLAIAALIVIALLAFGKTGMTWLKTKWDEITAG